MTYLTHLQQVLPVHVWLAALLKMSSRDGHLKNPDSGPENRGFQDTQFLPDPTDVCSNFK